jgi:hypothetical protein
MLATPLSGPVPWWEPFCIVTVTVTPRPPVATTAHAFTLPTVREIPPVYRPGTFSSTW